MASCSYDRDVSHCSRSKYVARTTIADVRPADNSDKLDVLTFSGLGYTTVAQRGTFKPGDGVYFIPGETMIPNELADKLGIRSYLSKSRVRTIKLRGNLSEGVIAWPQDVEPYLDGLLKWETPERFAQTGGGKRTIGLRFREWMKPDRPPVDFSRFYEMPNLLNAPKTFRVGEPVWVSEKIHGMNARYAFLPRQWKWWAAPLGWFNGAPHLYVGSHNVVLSPNRKSAWHDAYAQHVPADLPSGYVFFGEVYGRYNGSPIQHLTYGMTDIGLRFFSAFDIKAQQYLLPPVFLKLCYDHGLKHVQFSMATFVNVEGMREWANKPSEYTNEHHREGIVITSAERPGVMAKLISFRYLEEKNRTENKQ